MDAEHTTPLAVVPDPDSPLERLRAKRARLASQTTTDIPVAGYGGELVIRYRLLDPLADGKEIGARVLSQFPKDQSDQIYYAGVDGMIAACEGVYLRNADGDLGPIDPDDEKPPLFDARLASLLGFETASARETVLEVFGGNRSAVVAHSSQLNQWFRDTSGELGASGIA